MEKYEVAISFHDDLGVVSYDEENHAAEIELANDEGKALVENFLHETHEIQIPHNTLMDFTVEQINPLASKENFQLTLSRLWEATGVHVDWSRPVDYVRQHPRYTE